MTELEWLRHTDPSAMLVFARRQSRRKLRLAGCACYRAAWDAIPEGAWRDVVLIAERKADGAASRKEWAWVQRVAHEAHKAGTYTTATAGISHLTETRFSYLNAMNAVLNSGLSHPASRRDQPALLRDVLGNPFRPAQAVPGRRSPDAVAVAYHIYAERAFDLLPTLADALEEAGCEDERLLDHCRGPGPHARGCWVVDLVLAKE